MAADILLYRPEQVPVGDDQRQHVELTRDLALRFNRTYGPVFTVPEIATAAGRRAGDGPGRPHPRRWASPARTAAGVVRLLDPPDVVRRKVARAVTDSDTGPDAVRADREAKPGVTNLLEILAACGGSADGLTTYGALKRRSPTRSSPSSSRSRSGTPSWPPTPRTSPRCTPRAPTGCREVTAPVLAAAQAAIGL